MGWLKKLYCITCHAMTEHEQQQDMTWKCRESGCGQILGGSPLKVKEAL